MGKVHASEYDGLDFSLGRVWASRVTGDTQTRTFGVLEGQLASGLCRLGAGPVGKYLRRATVWPRVVCAGSYRCKINECCSATCREKRTREAGKRSRSRDCILYTRPVLAVAKLGRTCSRFAPFPDLARPDATRVPKAAGYVFRLCFLVPSRKLSFRAYFFWLISVMTRRSR